MSARVDGGGASSQIDAAHPLFQIRSMSTRSSYDVASDGQRFLVNTRVDEATSAPITVVTDWTAALEK